jgi:uncharacterized protein (TIGR00730 family)
MTGGQAMKIICVYCGSSDKMRQAYLEAARQMGAAIARRGLTVVYGAGCTGMMGAVADGALGAGGEVIGVIPELFATPQLMHTGLTRLEIVDSMHTRKARLAELADAFIALPGGFGTFEELFEMLTWAQIGLHRKPVGLLNTLDYFVPLLNMVEHAHNEGFLYEEHACLLSHASAPDDLLDALDGFTYPGGMERWLTREE